MNLKNFFNPHSVAVIGASSDKNKVGYALVSNLKNGDKRNIYPVSLSEKEIQGLKAYSSVKDIPGDIDLALIAVRADIVPTIMEECAAKGIKTVAVISAGFREIGPAGIELEKRVSDIAKKNNIALLGPNCLGVLNPVTRLNASFAADSPQKGHIAFLSQSGALGTAVLDKALEEGVGFSKFISLGNEASLTEIEFLEYLRDDEDTKAILMYVERLSDGPRFIKLASEITKNKPIVLIKAGRSAQGQRAVMSHTGSLAPASAVFSAACEQSGIIAVESIREFFNMAKLFQLGIMKPLQRMIILTNAGGPAVVTTDLIDLSRSLSLLELKTETKDSLRKALPPMAAVNNPVDIIGDALCTRYESALKILIEEKDADAIVTLLTPQLMTETEATAKLLAEYRKKKPIIPIFLGGTVIEGGLAELRNNGMINFTFPKDAVEALDNLARNADKIYSKLAQTSVPLPSKTPKVQTEKMLSYRDTLSLFRKYGLKLPGILLMEKKDIAGVVKNIVTATKIAGNDVGADLGTGTPIVYTLKAISPDVIHKTDMGAVKLGLKTLADIENAWNEIVNNVISKKPDAVFEGMLLEKMVAGKEIIIGMKRDAVFGPTVLFGLGGIFTEALKDTSLRIAPIDKKDALEMIRGIRGINILSGLRGEKPVNFDGLADIISKISRLAIENPEIKEIDLNPVMANQDDAIIVDVRVMI